MASRTTSSHALLFHLLAAASVSSCGLALLVPQVETSATTAQVQPAAGAQATPAGALVSLLAPVAEVPPEAPPGTPQRLSARGREAGELSECC